MDQIHQLYAEADVLLNINGAQERLDEHMGRMRRTYVESDPLAFQVEIARGDAAAIRTAGSYHSLFTFGENLGAADCKVPVVTFNWMPTRQPVVLNSWTNPFDGGERYRTITTWSTSESEIAYDGQTYYWATRADANQDHGVDRLSVACRAVQPGRAGS